MLAWRTTGVLVTIGFAFTAFGVGCTSTTADTGTSSSKAEAVDCEVTIVGGGAGGLHTAFRLGPSLGSRVCLFEREAELGGRIHDVSKTEGDANAPRVGVGARRIMSTQKVLIDLATELGIELEHPGDKADLINARKVVSFSKDEIQTKAYPTLGATPNDRETELYDLLRKGPERAKASTYADFKTYSQKVIGAEGYAFLRDVSRFRADFDYPLDARGYLDYLDEEWDTVDPSYPKGGMSSFIRGMEAKAVAAGVRIFKGEAITSVDKSGSAYEVKTAKHVAKSTKVVLAVPPVALDTITGDVPDRIKAVAAYKMIIGIPVVTVTQFWSDPWWKVVKNPANDTPVWRAWSTEHCFNFIEIPQEDYAAAQIVTRSVYVDDANCVAMWTDLAGKGVEGVEAEIEKGLTGMFNNGGVSSPATITIPKPLKTVVQVWPAAWHWLRSGATMTNAELSEWAVEPLAGEPVALVGEAYNPQRSGWSDGAYKSSIKLLNSKYGMSLPVGTMAGSVGTGHGGPSQH